MRSLTSLLGAVSLAALILSAGEGTARARKGRVKKAAPAAQAAEETRVAITKLMGKFKWGMTPGAVLQELNKDVEKEYLPKIQEEGDPLLQDRIRREMMEKKKELKSTHIQFTGKRTPWDVSLVDKEFGHRNDESMIVMWTKKDRRFYFFHHDRLWKLYIAFNTDLFKGKTFEDFARVMEARFGKADHKFAVTLRGDQKLDHLAWPPTQGTKMKAIDNTGFYGNFCLVLSDTSQEENVMTGRRLNSPMKKKGSALVEALTSGGGEDTSDENEGIVDRITGREDAEINKKRIIPKPLPSAAPTASSADDEEEDASSSARPTTPTQKKGKKIDSANPLDGLDL